MLVFLLNNMNSLTNYKIKNGLKKSARKKSLGQNLFFPLVLHLLHHLANFLLRWFLSH